MRAGITSSPDASGSNGSAPTARAPVPGRPIGSSVVDRLERGTGVVGGDAGGDTRGDETGAVVQPGEAVGIEPVEHVVTRGDLAGDRAQLRAGPEWWS